ncbi:MAG: MBL fold metallo-hydrolase [Deltaproteobacteria bacterium]|nr:MBL fold metallo-hydrolase [Deltaproteobacteria bacterium]
MGELKDVLSRRGVAVKTLDGGSLKETVNGVEVEVLHPLKGMEYDANNMSLVLCLRYGQDSFLFSGDIGEEAERALIRRDVGSTVLKVPHHGSRGSSTEGFLEKARPKIAVISAGRGNVFGFPHRETLERYRDIGAAVYRTDANGAVTATSGGEGIMVRTYLTGALP